MASVKRARTEEPAAKLDFSKPWKMSDVVLLVEDERFHVHRNVLVLLVLWSPVFEKMLNAASREKSKSEIWLAGKNADSVKTLQIMMYPPGNDEVTSENYREILELATEYQIASIVEKCECFLVDELNFDTLQKSSNHQDPISLLILAQKYELKELESVCVKYASRYNLKELQEHELYDSIEEENYTNILESIVSRMDHARVSLPSKETLKEIKAKGIENVDAIVKNLLKHASHKNFSSGRELNTQDDVEAYLLALTTLITAALVRPMISAQDSVQFQFYSNSLKELLSPFIKGDNSHSSFATYNVTRRSCCMLLLYIFVLQMHESQSSNLSVN